jgi:lipid A ethanolaminephosphotransferase
VCDGVGHESLEDDDIGDLCDGGDCFDEVLVDRTRTLAEHTPGDLVLVLHQKGSHGPAYFRRYPPRFARYTPECSFEDLSRCSREEIRNSYDNSILYTDFVLAELVRALAGMSDRRDTAMLYVSDHGESLGESGFYLHGLPYMLAPDVQTHVPMVFWMSEGFAARFGIDRDRLAQVAALPCSHDNLFHSVLGMLDVRTDAYDPALDLFRDTHMESGESRADGLLRASKQHPGSGSVAGGPPACAARAQNPQRTAHNRVRHP